jgi:hypothetical protein
MDPKRLLGAMLLIVLPYFLQAQQVKKVDYTKCFEVVSKQWKTHCDSDDSFEVRWKNVCEQPMDLKYAIRQKNGTWEVGIDFTVQPGEETVNVAWVCHGTGHYLWWARPSDQWMDVAFPADDEIQKLH